MKSTNSIARLLILALLLGLLAGCGKPATRREGDSSPNPSPSSGAPTPTGEAGNLTPTGEPGVPTPSDTPSGTPAPTGEPGNPSPTGEPASPTPTSAPSATPTPTVPNYSGFPLEGTWYCKAIQGLESDLTECKNDPTQDYRLKIYDDCLEYFHSTDRLPGSSETTVQQFELRTEFDEDEIKRYREMNYGMDSYALDPTDIGRGHYVYSCTDGLIEGALFIIDVQPDHSLKTLYAAVDDNGSFPIFVDGVYTTEPVYPTGTYFEDYVGTWHCRSVAPFYEESYEFTGENVLFTMDLVVYENGTLDFIDVSNDISLAKAERYTLRTTEFSEAELAKYKKWDDAGFLVWEERMQGEAEAAAKQGTNLLEGRLIYVCDNPAMDGQMIILSWNKEFKQLDVNLYGFDAEISREHLEYLTYKRATVRKVTPGETYESYIGIWKLTEYRSAGDDEMTFVSSPEGYAPLEISFTKEGELLEAREVFSDRSVRYALRTEAKASDPAWYTDIDAAGTFTSFANHRLVFVCTDASYYPGALLIITRNPNGTISARFYGKNAGGNVLDRPYCGYERVNGLGRTDDPDFKP